MITTHVLDIARGKPAANVGVRLERLDEGEWRHVGSGRTDRDGRLKTLVPENGSRQAGTYRLTFETGAYFDAQGIKSFHPQIDISFLVRDAADDHHVPLLVSPFGYTTYRGS